MKKSVVFLICFLITIFGCNNSENSSTEDKHKEALVDSLNKEAAKTDKYIEEAARNDKLVLGKIDSGNKDEYDESIVNKYYYNNDKLIKIETYTGDGYSFYLLNNKLFFIDINGVATSEKHYFDKGKWIFGKDFTEGTEVILTYNAVKEKELLEMFNELFNKRTNLDVSYAEAKYVFGELHHNLGYTLEFVDNKTNKSYIFKFPTYEDYKKINIELVDFETKSTASKFENKNFIINYTQKEGINENSGEKEIQYNMISIRQADIK